MTSSFTRKDSKQGLSLLTESFSERLVSWEWDSLACWKGKLGVQEAQEDVACQQVHLCEFRRTFSVVVEQKRDAKSTHLEYSSLLLRASIPSLPFFLIKVKVSETIQYRVLASKLFLGSTWEYLLLRVIIRAFNYNDPKLDYPKSPT